MEDGTEVERTREGKERRKEDKGRVEWDGGWKGKRIGGKKEIRKERR
jgi:hypothetical protein